MNPIVQFEQWFSEEKQSSNNKLPAACCLSTIGLDNYPNSRFVSLKEIVNDSFVITGSLNSRKGSEIEKSSKAALAFWWASTERQVRIQGDASTIPRSDATTFFNLRSRDSKIVSDVFNQGKEIESVEQMKRHFEENKKLLDSKEIERPDQWGGFLISPIRIEFMQFKENRLHERKLYQNVDNTWELTVLQP